MFSKVRAAALTNYFEIAEQVGLNPGVMLGQAGIARTLLNDPDNRIPATAVIQLLELSAQQAQCENFGLCMAETRQISDFGAISLLLTHQGSLRDALQAMIEYRYLLNEALSVHVEDAGRNVIIREEIIVDGHARPRQATELALGVMMRACSALLGMHWNPLCVRFTHSAPADLRVHRRLFRCKLEFDAEFNGFVCVAADLDYPCSKANPALARHAEKLLQTLPKSGDKSTLMEVKEAIYLLLPMRRATIDQVAQSLALNVRTLQRQLEEEGETFSDLINSVRRELAIRHIESGQHSLGHIADLLGYSTQTSFTRWFKAEFGVAPTRWKTEG